MKFAQRFLLVATVVAAFATSSFAGPNPVGSWKGKVIVDVSKMQKMPDPKQQEAVAKSLAMTRKIEIGYVFKADKTFVAATTGAPMAIPPQGGTWAVKGNSVVVTSKGSSQTFSLSSDGKTMTLNFPPSRGATAKLVLKR